jgi:hypothetical protein
MISDNTLIIIMLQTIFRLSRDKSEKKDSSTFNEKDSSTLNEDESSLVAGSIQISKLNEFVNDLLKLVEFYLSAIR